MLSVSGHKEVPFSFSDLRHAYPNTTNHSQLLINIFKHPKQNQKKEYDEETPTWQNPRIIMIYVEQSDDIKPQPLPEDDVLQVEVEKLFLGGMEAEPR